MEKHPFGVPPSGGPPASAKRGHSRLGAWGRDGPAGVQGSNPRLLYPPFRSEHHRAWRLPERVAEVHECLAERGAPACFDEAERLMRDARRHRDGLERFALVEPLGVEEAHGFIHGWLAEQRWARRRGCAPRGLAADAHCVAEGCAMAARCGGRIGGKWRLHTTQYGAFCRIFQEIARSDVRSHTSENAALFASTRTP